MFTLDAVGWFLLGVLVGLFLQFRPHWLRERAGPPIVIHEGHAPYRRRCHFMAVHECSCVLDAGHEVKHVCIHGAQWGAFDRPVPRPEHEMDA